MQTLLVNFHIYNIEEIPGLEPIPKSSDDEPMPNLSKAKHLKSTALNKTATHEWNQVQICTTFG